MHDIQSVPHLLAVSVENNWFLFQCLDNEMGYPALVFIAKLMRTINATHSKNKSPKAIRANIVSNVLICSTLGTSIGAMEIQRLFLINAGKSVICPFITISVLP